jgi:phage terminase small subunit
MLRRAITKPIHAPTELQSAFVEAYLDGHNATQSALLAGCAPSWAPQAGSQYLKDTGVAFAIVKGAVKRLARKVPMAINVLDWLAQNAASEKVRLDSAKSILALAGIVPPKAEASSNAVDKALHELTIEELRALVGRYEHERAATAIDITPETAPDSDKPVTTAPENDQAPDAEPMPIDDVDLIG